MDAEKNGKARRDAGPSYFSHYFYYTGWRKLKCQLYIVRDEGDGRFGGLTELRRCCVAFDLLDDG